MMTATRNRSHRLASSRNRAVMEALEGRQLFSLLGVLPGLPNTSVLGNDGSLTYSAANHTFDATGAPTIMVLSADANGATVVPVGDPKDFQLHISVNNNGGLLGSGAVGSDLVLSGNVDVNNDGIADYSGVLLTGKITAFGFEDAGTNDNFDFQFTVTGGAMASQYFQGKDIGVLLTTENSTFDGSFASDFSAKVKGKVGPMNQSGAIPSVIAGHKYQDVSGNGMSADDLSHPVSGWGINLYNDVNGNGKLDGSDTLAASTTTGADGSYAFNGIAAGKYVVAEETRSGWIQTGPVSGSYGVTVAAGESKLGLDFDNFQKTDCACGLKCVYYVINGCRTVNDISGQLHQGDTVKVVFTTTSNVTLSLVSYTAPEGTFVADHASQQKIFDVDTQTFGPGTHSLTVTVPDCYFQVDFVCGLPIDKFGPAGSNVFYTPQGRLIDSANGGKNACGCGCGSSTGTGSISGQVICDCNNNGKLDKGETGIKGVKITLSGTTNDGLAVTLTTTTDANGNYVFANLKAGKYTVTETGPANFFDGIDKAGSVGGTVGNDVISNIVIGNGTKATAYNFAELAGAKISGTIFCDADKDGKQDRNEAGIKGVKITLSGTDDQGNAVCLSVYTDACGNYSFTNLRKGSYTLTETQPDGYLSTKSMAGSNGGRVCGNSISSICLNWCDEACGYNFGEAKTPAPVCTPAPRCGNDRPSSCTPAPVCSNNSNSSTCGSGFSSNCSNLVNAFFNLLSAFMSKC